MIWDLIIQKEFWWRGASSIQLLCCRRDMARERGNLFSLFGAVALLITQPICNNTLDNGCGGKNRTALNMSKDSATLRLLVRVFITQRGLHLSRSRRYCSPAVNYEVHLHNIILVLKYTRIQYVHCKFQVYIENQINYLILKM